MVKFWWIEERRWRQVVAILILTGATTSLGILIKPERTNIEIVDHRSERSASFPTAAEIAEEVIKREPRQNTQVQLAPEQLTIQGDRNAKVHRPAERQQPINVEERVSIANMNRDFHNSLPFWVSYPTPNGNVISPAAYLGFFRLTNTIAHPLTVKSFSLAIRTHQCDWTTLIPIFLGDVDVFWVYQDIRHALPLDFEETALDRKLASPIRAYGSVSGWLLFDTAVKCELKNQETQDRFWGETVTGEKFEYLGPWQSVTSQVKPKQRQTAETDRALLCRKGDPVDLSALKPVFYSDQLWLIGRKN
jgi:hypothetical protein